MTEKYFRPRNWGKYQSKAKNASHWVKIQTSILDDPEFLDLSPVNRYAWLALLACFRRAGKPLPLSYSYAARVLDVSLQQARSALDTLLSKKFIELCDLASDLYPEVESPREEKRREEKKDSPLRGPPSDGAELNSMVEGWNRLAEQVGLSRVERLSATRRQKMRRRLAEVGGLDGWNAALEKIRGSPFLLGRNDRNWRVSFDFLLQEKSFTKLCEGAYDEAERVDGRAQVNAVLERMWSQEDGNSPGSEDDSDGPPRLDAAPQVGPGQEPEGIRGDGGRVCADVYELHPRGSAPGHGRMGCDLDTEVLAPASGASAVHEPSEGVECPEAQSC